MKLDELKFAENSLPDGVAERAVGCLTGQLIGDSLGSLVEFRSAEDITADYPDGVRDLADGGPFDLAAGQPTDDSEMALALARSMDRRGAFDVEDVLQAYRQWAATNPPDIGHTCAMALRFGQTNPQSEANGALMRISPLAIAYHRDAVRAGQLAVEDAALTHPASRTLAANRFYVSALARVIAGQDAKDAVAHFAYIYDDDLMASQHQQPDVSDSIGWVHHAVRLVVHEVFSGRSFEESLVNVVGLGGDSDTNAAIVGAFLGAVHGVGAIPQRWMKTVRSCTPKHGRSSDYAPNDFVELAVRLAALNPPLT